MKSTEMSLEEIFLKLTSGEYVAPPKEAPAPKPEGKPKKAKGTAARLRLRPKKIRKGVKNNVGYF